MKTCTKCLELKELDAFHRKHSGKMGRRSICKTCRALDEKVRYENKDIIVVIPETKECNQCLMVKDQSSFSRCNSNPTGLRGKCRTCTRANSKNTRRNSHLQRKYDITSEEYGKMLANQDNKCKICKNTDDKHLLVVDHCHTTGRVRGLLCRKCNTMLGFAKDNPDVLQRAISYLNTITV